MTDIEVFRPSNGPLMIPNNLAHGIDVPMDLYRKERPATRGFGRLSHNSFFTRHNPHPARVRHLKGLLDIPICAVNDEGHFPPANYCYSTTQFPPNNYDSAKLQAYRVPVNSINVNSNIYPLNTITGLPYFSGIFKERAVPKVGMVPVTDMWRDELRRLTEEAGLNLADHCGTREKPRQTIYSESTGRLVPPPSRAMTRGGPRISAQERMFVHGMEHIAAMPDVENTVLQMLCQILQTDDVNAVQSWIVSAGDKEKALVLDLVKAVVETQQEYYSNEGPSDVRPQTTQDQTRTLPTLQESGTQTSGHGHSATVHAIDRLARQSPGAAEDSRWSRYSWAHPDEQRLYTPNNVNRLPVHQDEDKMVGPGQAFEPRPPRQDYPAPMQSRPTTSQHRPQMTFTQQRPATMQSGRPATMQNGRIGTGLMRPSTKSKFKNPINDSLTSPVFKYSKSRNNRLSQSMIVEREWQPNESTATN